MKVRHGFVSNSSSSSFTCGVCNKSVEIWDDGEDLLRDAGMFECVHGHIVHHDSWCSKIKGLYNLLSEGTPNRWEVPEKMCPICNLEVITDKTALEYVFTKFNITAEEIDSEIREKYGSLVKVKEWIDENKIRVC